MMLCPYCSEEMAALSNEEHQGYPDTHLYLCEICQIEQIVRWDTGERYLFQREEDHGDAN